MGMKIITLTALSAEKRVAIAAARVTGTNPVVVGNFCTRCKCCGRNQPIKGFAPDPARKLSGVVCAHCAQLRTPRLSRNSGKQRDVTLQKI